MKIRYIAADGGAISLNSDGILCDESSLLQFTWDYDYNTMPNNSGGYVTSFYKNAQKFKFVLIFYSTSSDATASLINGILGKFEKDLRNKTPGKIMLNDQYMTGYIVAGEVKKRSRTRDIVEQSFTFLPTMPFWCTEDTIKTETVSYESLPNSKRYPNRYPYRYAQGFTTDRYDNTDEPWETPMIITAYGACTNPSITIGGTTYGLSVSLNLGEKAVINQLKHTITKIDSLGTETNIFYSRNKAFDIFKFCPAGEVAINRSGDAIFEITFIHQRSEPIWTS